MASRTSTESHLEKLRQLRAGGASEAAIESLREIFRAKNVHGIVIKTASELAQKFDAKSLAPEIAAVVAALMETGAAKRDPGCFGKTAAAKALVEWEAGDAALFARAANCTQMEGTIGGAVDTAAEFRGLAALGIAITAPVNAVDILVDLLADPEKQTRQQAAIALGMWRGPEAMGILRLKARIGDDDPDTFAEVLAAILRQDPQGNLALVAEFLGDQDQAKAEAAALALGQSKMPAALEPLTAAWPRLRGTRIATSLLMSISLLRSDAAIDWLLAQLPDCRASEALNIFDALALHKHDQKLLSRMREIISKHSHLRKPFEQVFSA